MVHAKPGITRATDMVYDKFDEELHLSKVTLYPEPSLPVLIGIDGGLTPAACYGQEMPDGQLRVLREIALERGGMLELAAAMLALEARDFRGCDFHAVCDPAMVAGEDKDVGDNTWREDQRVSSGSDRQRLAEKLGRRVELAVSNVASRRWDAVRDKIGPPGRSYLLDPSCKGLIRGKRQTYQFRKLQGSNDLSSVRPSFDTHIADAEQYMAMECGTDAARKRKTDMRAGRAKAREENRAAKRYNPVRRAR